MQVACFVSVTNEHRASAGACFIGDPLHALVKWQFHIVLLPPQNGQRTETKGSWSPANPWITFLN